jgi:hypothetical protein
MNTITASPRLTFGYRDGWSHLDSWGDSMKFKVLGGRIIEAGNSYDEGGRVLYHVVGDKRADQATQLDALRSYFSGSSCRHEHDCCGCASTSASIKPIRPGLFTVLVRTSYNY